MFTEIKKDDLKEIEGGRWNWKLITGFWGICYSVGYAVGETVGNLFK